MGQVWCLSGPKVPKSKLELPKVTIRGQIILQPKSPRCLEKIGYTSSNDPPGNYYKVLNKHLIGHVLRGQNGGLQICPSLVEITNIGNVSKIRTMSGMK